MNFTAGMDVVNFSTYIPVRLLSKKCNCTEFAHLFARRKREKKEQSYSSAISGAAGVNFVSKCRTAERLQFLCSMRTMCRGDGVCQRRPRLPKESP